MLDCSTSSFIAGFHRHFSSSAYERENNLLLHMWYIILHNKAKSSIIFLGRITL